MKWSRKKAVFLFAGVVLATAYYFCLPTNLFNNPYSTVLEDYRGELLSASIAEDGQWRFPSLDTVPQKFIESVVLFEDKRFYSHPGVDILSLGRAVKQNMRAGKVVSGGSTITMQVIRLARKGESRTYLEKLLEIILATRLELRSTKAEILALYASHAPFGGNVVGIEAACWRYFGRRVDELSWGEAALLAVLPNAPSLIHPGKNRDQLKAKRNQLLEQLFQTGKLDDVELELAMAEPLPEEPLPLPRYARHLLSRATKEGHAQHRLISTVQLPLQERVEQIINDHHLRLKGNQIFNAAALVVEIKTGNVLAYVGNNNKVESGYHGEEVDVITAPRSTGSILKPFLFTAMLDEGKILPQTLLPDIPTQINGFAPKNFSKEYDGAVPASQALIRSLNVPAVYMLQDYRYEKFHSLLKDLGMTSLNKPPDHYGLSLILGGAEGTLWDITGMYASLARRLNHFGDPERNDFHRLNYVAGHQASSGFEEKAIHLSASSIYQTLDALTELYRPGEETGWRNFSSSKKIAWKTGTSFGFRDGWAVGVTPEYAVGVWVGNADGEGRPGLTGTETAAPILFDIFSQLPGNAWFHQPYLEMEQIAICSRSGLRFTSHCESADTCWVSQKGLEAKACSYHRVVHVTADLKYRVHSECMTLNRITSAKWFVLSPIQEYYYKTRNVSYRTLPPYRKDCANSLAVAAMDLVYPKPNARIFIPRELDGGEGNTVFELAHRNPRSIVYWHLDGQYMGSTQKRHHLAIQTEEGKHVLTLVDDAGEALERHFVVLSK